MAPVTLNAFLWDHLAIERLNADFAHELDRGTPEGFAALFAPDALYVRGDRRLVGHAAILDFAKGRVSQGPRTSRHVVSGLRLDFERDDCATGISCCTTFSAGGAPPITSTVPALVADFNDVYVRSEGRWLFRERHILAQFQAA